MAITAKLLSQKSGNAGVRLAVEFNDDGELAIKKYRDYEGSPSDFVKLIRSQAIKREEIKLYDFSSFVGNTIDITPDPVIQPAPPTAAEIAKKVWFDDWRKLNQTLLLTEKIPALATTQANTEIANLRTSLEAGFLNSYRGDI